MAQTGLLTPCSPSTCLSTSGALSHFMGQLSFPRSGVEKKFFHSTLYCYQPRFQPLENFPHNLNFRSEKAIRPAKKNSSNSYLQYLFLKDPKCVWERGYSNSNQVLKISVFLINTGYVIGNVFVGSLSKYPLARLEMWLITINNWWNAAIWPGYTKDFISVRHTYRAAPD